MARPTAENETVHIIQIHANRYFKVYDETENHSVTPDKLSSLHCNHNQNYIYYAIGILTNKIKNGWEPNSECENNFNRNESDTLVSLLSNVCDFSNTSEINSILAQKKTETITAELLLACLRENYKEIHGIIQDKKADNEKGKDEHYILNDTVYIGTMPDSLELRYLKRKAKNEFRLEKKTNGKYICLTDSIIDVIFDESYWVNVDGFDYYYNETENDYTKKIPKREVSMLKNKMRENMYVNGFDVCLGEKVRHYVFYQRGSSKVKDGHCLFIVDTLKKDIDEWAFMGLDFTQDEKCDMTSLLAYRALTTSGIEGTVDIKPEEILLINDLAPRFKQVASATRYNPDSKRIYAVTEEVEQKQELFDGQSLLDASKFIGKYSDKGCVLLRNKFFKSCAFNTNIQLWFSDHGIETITDMFGRTHKANNIKLITTPNSLKVLKFAYKTVFKSPDDNENLISEEKAQMFDHWLSNIDSEFGIVKYEKPSHIESDDEFVRNQLSYQMVNTLPLSLDDVNKLCAYNIKKIEMLRDDFETFKKYLNDKSSSGNGNSISLAALCNINPEVRYTALYKNQRRKVIENLKTNLCKGRIIVKADNCTMVSCPIEMLRWACGEEITDDMPIFSSYEIYTSLYEKEDDGIELTAFRSPHIASGNVCVLKNKHHVLLDRYMNLTPNIVVVNAYKNDLLSRLQGADTDSDFVIIVNNPIVLKAAKECMKFPTPYNEIKGTPKLEKWDMKTLAKKDTSISDNYIGKICNLGQVFNSYYWDYKYNGADQKKLNEIYNNISMLSSLSQIEIDRAKKNFGDLGVGAQYLTLTKSDIIEREEETHKRGLDEEKIADRQRSINQYEFGEITEEEFSQQMDAIENYIIQKQVRPNFFKPNSVDSSCHFRHFDTPMDYVLDCVDKIPKARKEKNYELIDLLAERPNDEPDRKKADLIEETSKTLHNRQIKLFGIKKTKRLEQDREKWASYNKKFHDEVEHLKKHSISQATMYRLICHAYGRSEGHLKCKDDLKDCKKTLLDLIAAAYPETFYKCFDKFGLY